MVRFALFGAGFIGQVHGGNLAAHPHTRLQYVYDVNAEAAQRLAGRYGAQVARSVEEIFGAEDVDAVLIASSTHTHADLLRAAIRARKPVYCEKPIDMSLDRVKAVVQEAHDTPVPVMRGFSRRFDPNHRALREAVLDVDTAMRDMEQSGFDASLSGTTACCALVVGRRVLVASTGDSRCVVARRAPDGQLEVVPLTWDAKPSLPEERKRIAASGGVVKQLLDECGQRVGAHRVFSHGDDVLPGLAMSRSLGDLYAHSVGVSAEPVLNTYTLGDRDLFMVGGGCPGGGQGGQNGSSCIAILLMRDVCAAQRQGPCVQPHSIPLLFPAPLCC